MGKPSAVKKTALTRSRKSARAAAPKAVPIPKQSRPPADLSKCPPFGRLTALSYVGSRDGNARWRCRCRCGRVVVVPAYRLKSGKTTSCGCAAREATVKRHEKLITHKGRTLSLVGWAKVTGFSPEVIGYRLNHGWSVADALTIPPRVGNNQHV